MHKLCVFVVRIWHKAGYLMTRLISWGPLKGGRAGGGGGYRFLCSPEKVGICPCSPKSKSWFSMSHVPQNCLCSPVPFSFRLLFPFSPEINGLIPLFPKTSGRASIFASIVCHVYQNLLLTLHRYLHTLNTKCVNILPGTNQIGCRN